MKSGSSLRFDFMEGDMLLSGCVRDNLMIPNRPSLGKMWVVVKVFYTKLTAMPSFMDLYGR